MNTADPDAAPTWKVPAESTAVEGRMELNAELPMAPSGWRVREALSYDLPVLWPAEYEAVVRAFEHAGRRRSATRFCAAAACAGACCRRRHGTAARRRCPTGDMKLVRVRPDRDQRVFVTTTVSLAAPIPTGSAPRSSIPACRRCAADAGAAGRRGNRWRARAGGCADRRGRRQRGHGRGRGCRRKASSCCATRSIRRGARRSTALPAELVRANGLYRAVRVPAGRHVIRFRYRPRELVVGLTISGMTALALVIVCTALSPEAADADVRSSAGHARLHARRADDRAGDHRHHAGDRLRRVSAACRRGGTSRRRWRRCARSPPRSGSSR